MEQEKLRKFDDIFKKNNNRTAKTSQTTTTDIYCKKTITKQAQTLSINISPRRFESGCHPTLNLDQILQENYGTNDPLAVSKVKEVYSKINLKKVYHDYEENSYAKLVQLIDKAPNGLPKEIFTELAAKIYKRNK